MTSTRRTWWNMLDRCNNSEHPEYHRYGGRGIKVCAAWRQFSNFVADMGWQPDGLTIERIDNNGDYEPGNCRWATRAEQQSNRVDTVRLTNAGITDTLTGWAQRLGMTASAFHCRYKKYADQPEKLFAPRRRPNGS